MKIRLMPVDDVIPYENNPRDNHRAVAKVAASLNNFGWRQPIVVDEDMVILAGHTRLQAAVSLGHTKVPVHVATGLTEKQKRAYRLADNKTGEYSTWLDDALKNEIEALQIPDDDGDEVFDLSLTGFSDKQIAKMLGNPIASTSRNVDGEQHLVVVELETEEECAQLYDELMDRGLACKIMS